MTKKLARKLGHILLGYAMIAFGLILGWRILFDPAFLPDVRPRVPIEALTLDEFLKLSSTDLNTAGQLELMELPGIGRVLSARILEYREEHGGFAAVDELMEVKGIGEKTLESIRKYVYVE